jgi:hypothetical protein
VVNNADAAELRIVIAAVLAAAADVVLVAQHLLKLRAHLVTSLARVKVWRRGARGIKRAVGGRRKVRNSV